MLVNCDPWSEWISTALLGFLRLPDHRSLAHIFLRPSAQRVLQPGVEAAGLDAQTPAHRTHREQRAMLGYERVSTLHPWRNTRWQFLGCRAPRSPASARASAAGSRHPSIHLPGAAQTDASTHTASVDSRRAALKPPPPNTPLGNLRHRIALGLIAEKSPLTHRSLLSSI